MKRIKYTFLSAEVNHGTEEEPNIERKFIPKEFPYSEEGFEAAKREAYGGEPEIYDDGQPEPEQPMTDAERIAQLEEALEMLLSGVTE